MQISLTAKQHRLLAYLREHVAETGTFPSLRQAAGDLASVILPWAMLKLLEKNNSSNAKADISGPHIF
ncbi:MAG: hypothetical protein R2875_18610 [Desulfobacterales bacterium]